MQKSRVLVLDIETAPILAYVWGLKEQNITPRQIYKDWHILAWSAKWLDDAPNKIVYYDQRNMPLGDDRKLLIPLWKMLDEADTVITQNGREFDAKKINARFMLHGIHPPKPYKHLDTYQIVKKVAAFTSNKLEYLTDKFCTKYKKLSHSRFPGWSLWIECIGGNKEAWEEMKRYNIHDVLSTEEFYLKIRAWTPESMPRVYQMTDRTKECGTCGYKGTLREGKPRQTKRYRYKQNQCPKCGAWQEGEKIE